MNVNVDSAVWRERQHQGDHHEESTRGEGHPALEPRPALRRVALLMAARCLPLSGTVGRLSWKNLVGIARPVVSPGCGVRPSFCPPHFDAVSGPCPSSAGASTMLYAAMYAATSSASHFMSSRDVMGELVTGSMADGASVSGVPACV